jgi:hypothetical protein
VPWRITTETTEQLTPRRRAITCGGSFAGLIDGLRKPAGSLALLMRSKLLMQSKLGLEEVDLPERVAARRCSAVAAFALTIPDLRPNRRECPIGVDSVEKVRDRGRTIARIEFRSANGLPVNLDSSSPLGEKCLSTSGACPPEHQTFSTLSTPCGLSVASVACWSCVSQSEANGIFNGKLIYIDARMSSACQILEECHAKIHLHGNVYRHRNSR